METDCLRMHIKSPIQQSMDISINSMRPLFLGSEHLKPNRVNCIQNQIISVCVD